MYVSGRYSGSVLVQCLNVILRQQQSLQTEAFFVTAAAGKPFPDSAQYHPKLLAEITRRTTSIIIVLLHGTPTQNCNFI